MREKTSQRQYVEQTVSRVIALQWDSLKIEVLDAGKEVAIIPVRYKNHDLVKECYRKLFIFQDQQGNDQVKIVEIRADSSYLKSNQNQINKHNFTGTITIHDLYKGFENGVVVENGNLTNAIIKYTFQNPSTQRDSDCGHWVFVSHQCYASNPCGNEHDNCGYWYFKLCTTNPNDLYNSGTGYIDWMLWLDNQYANDYAQSSGGGGGYTGNDYGDPYYNYQPPAGYEPVYLDEPQEPDWSSDEFDGENAITPSNFSDPEKIYTKLRNEVNNQIGLFQNILNNDSLSNLTPTQKAILKNIFLPELKKMKSELKILARSSQKYKIQRNADLGVFYQPSTGEIVINVPNKIIKSALGTTYEIEDWFAMSHEFKHAFQFEERKLSFNLQTGNAGALYDLHDEIEAYQRQTILISNFDYGKVDYMGKPVNYQYKIDAAEVRKIGLTMNPVAYQGLVDMQITLNSTVGNSIIHQCEVENSCEEYYKK